MHPASHHEETFSRYVALSWANALYSRPVAKGGEDSQALREIAAKLIEIAAKLISMAVRGDLQAMKIADQIEGKVPQAQIIQGYDDGGPIRLFAAVPFKSATSEQWLEDIGRRPKLIDVVAREKAE